MHPIREDLNSRVMPTCGWTDHDPVMGTTRDLVSTMELNPFLVMNILTFPFFTSDPFAPRNQLPRGDLRRLLYRGHLHRRCRHLTFPRGLRGLRCFIQAFLQDTQFLFHLNEILHQFNGKFPSTLLPTVFHIRHIPSTDVSPFLDQAAPAFF